MNGKFGSPLNQQGTGWMRKRSSICQRMKTKSSVPITKRLSHNALQSLKKTNAQLQRLLHVIELTERKLATDSLDIDLNDEEEVMVSSEEGVITADRDLKIVIINEPALQMLAREENDAVGASIGEVFASNDPSIARRLDASLKSMASSGTAQEPLGTIPVQSRSGNPLELVSYAEPIIDSDGERMGVVLTFKDAAESRKKDSEALRTQKLVLLNLMVRGVAHDFNNILSSVLANIQTGKDGAG